MIEESFATRRKRNELCHCGSGIQYDPAVRVSYAAGGRL
ncbi:MAG: SEC-C metal-binding domain-containing protein [Dysosmobacter sp.]